MGGENGFDVNIEIDIDRELEQVAAELGLRKSKNKNKGPGRGVCYNIVPAKDGPRVVIDRNGNKVKGFVVCADCRDSDTGQKYLAERFGELGADFWFGGTKSKRPCSLCGKAWDGFKGTNSEI